MRKRVYATVAVVVASLSMTGCFDACNLVNSGELGADPNPATVGEQVTFTTSFRMNSGTPTEVEFDLDGDGSLETKANPVRLPSPPGLDVTPYRATAHRSYGTPATIAVRSVVKAVSRGTPLTLEGLFGLARQVEIVEYHVVDPLTFQVQQGQDQPPLASFTVTPNPVVPEGQVTYDASESMDPDGGQIVKYEWDRNGDGTYELDTGSSPTLTEMEPGQGFPGRYTVGLRVTDGGGATAVTTREVIVEHPARIGSPSKLPQRLDAARSFELSPRLRELDTGELMINGDELIIQGRVDRGRLPASVFPASLRRGKRKVRWLSSTDAVIDTVANSGTADGFALLSFPAGGRACMAFHVDVPQSGRPDGRFRVLGGVGRAAGLRGRGMGEARATKKGIAVSGHLDFDFGGKRNFRLERSGCAPLLNE